MVRCLLPLLVPLLVASAGCHWPQTSTTLVPEAPFGTDRQPPPAHVTCSPATAAVAARVQATCDRLAKVNPQMGLGPHPYCQVAGESQPEIFHQGTTLVITEGLVKLCPEDNQLAAVLSLELAKMIADRETAAPVRQPDPPPPLEMGIGGDGGGVHGFADHTDQAILWKTGGDRRPTPKVAARPDPQSLARGYLANAGYTAADLDAVAPVLQAARANSTLEKQYNSAAPAPPRTALPG